jgi:predicted Fe-S protein YdhL (DUF1289 family)
MYDSNDVWSKYVKLEITSPCNNTCVISSQTGICTGCFRTLKEIVDWESVDLADKEVILQKVEERRKKNEV